MDVVRTETGDLICTVVLDHVWADFSFSRLVQEQIQAGDRRLILDLAFIDLLHSPGLANLVALHVHCQKRDVTFLLRHVNPANQRLLRSTRLDQLLATEPETAA